MLDVYNAIAGAVRGAGGAEQSVSELNERLRAVFDELRVDTGVVGVLPVLRGDFIEQYRDTATVMADYDNAIPTSNLSDSSPAVLWATDPPPVKALAVPTETGRNVQEPWHCGRRGLPLHVGGRTARRRSRRGRAVPADRRGPWRPRRGHAAPRTRGVPRRRANDRPTP